MEALMSRERAQRETRRAVEASGLTRKAFAEKAGVTVDTVADFIDGRRWAQGPKRNAIERALGWPLGRIAELAEEPGVVNAQARDEGAERTDGGSPKLSVVREKVEPMDDEEDNEVLAAIRRDPDLDEAEREHFLNQYVLLRKLSRLERSNSRRLEHVAYDPQTGFDPKLEEEIERDVRKAADENPDSPYRDK